MRKLYDLLVKLSDLIFVVEKWVLVAAVIIAVAVNSVNVCMRYVLNSGLSYCETLSICMFMFMVVIGGNIAVKTDSEIKIEIFRFKAPRVDAAYKLIVDLIVVAAIIFALIGLIATVQNVMVNLQRVTPLPIYTYHVYIVMTIGFFMILLDRIIILLKHILTVCGQAVEGGAKTL